MVKDFGVLTFHRGKKEEIMIEGTPFQRTMQLVLLCCFSFLFLVIFRSNSQRGASLSVKKSREILIYLSKFELSVRWFLTRNGE